MILEGKNIQLYIRDRLLLDIPGLHISKGARIGLVGRNGCGKTSLLEILAGLKQPDKGQITPYVSCELIPQIPKSPSVKSGGERTREAIITALSRDPGLLLADEPTTNLDTSHIEWLEKQLADWQGAFIIVSHDRTFLDALCTTIWEIRDSKLYVYAGNYSDYFTQRELEDRQQDEAYEQYVNERKKIELAIRMKKEKAERATKKPRNVSVSESKITGAKPYFAKKQKKLQKTAKALETRMEKLEKVEKRRELPPVKMNLLNSQAFLGKIVMRIEQLEGRIGQRILWHPVSFYIRGGDKLAIIGPNGCGKTTLVKRLMASADGKDRDCMDSSRVSSNNGHMPVHPDNNGDESMCEGKVSISPSVRIGYFSQTIDILDAESSILDNVRKTSSQEESLIRTVLARLHFFRDDVYKPVKVLSGGERVKVALAKLFVSDVNTLVLDEPTNYLDIASIEALENMLSEYEGTVLFVSHDRRFIRRVARRILAFENRQIRLFEGSYEQYVATPHPDTEAPDDREQRLLLIDTKITEVLSRLSMEPTEELEEQFQALLAEKRKLGK